MFYEEGNTLDIFCDLLIKTFVFLIIKEGSFNLTFRLVSLVYSNRGSEQVCIYFCNIV